MSRPPPALLQKEKRHIYKAATFEVCLKLPSKGINQPESDVVDFFVVRNELCLDLSRYADPPHSLSSLKGPDGTGGVDGRGAQEVGVHFVPVKGGEGGAKVGVFVVVQEALQAGLGLAGTPNAQVVAGRCQ